MLSKRFLTPSSCSFSSSSSSSLLFSTLRFCAASSSTKSAENKKNESNNNKKVVVPPFLVPVRSLMRLGENSDLIRRALTTQNEDQLVKVAKKFFAIHKKRLSTIKDLNKTGRFNIPKRMTLKMKLRLTRANLYWERCKIRGYGALADLLVVGVLISFAAFSYSVFQALYIWMKRQQTLEMMTAQITHTVNMLEAHGNDGEKLVNARKARGDVLPMPEEEKDWHLYSNKK